MGFIPPAPLPGPSVFSPQAPVPRPIETKGGRNIPPVGVTSPLGGGFGVTSPLGAGFGGVSLMEQMKIREREREGQTKALKSAAEEDTDNWDDDFEEGISFTKLQGASSLACSPLLIRSNAIGPDVGVGMDKDKPNGTNGDSSREDKIDVDENAQTIRPAKSPGGRSAVLSTPPPMMTIVEDYSDLADEDEDMGMELERKVASFKVRVLVPYSSVFVKSICRRR